MKFSRSTFKIHGLTESKLDDLVKPVDLGPQDKLSFRAHYPDLTLRLTASGGKGQEKGFVERCEQIRRILGTYIYAEGDVALEEKVGQLLMEKNQTLALAESCTGGLISHRITRIAGSSAYYFGGAVTYANEAKVKFLGVEAGNFRKIWRGQRANSIGNVSRHPGANRREHRSECHRHRRDRAAAPRKNPWGPCGSVSRGGITTKPVNSSSTASASASFSAPHKPRSIGCGSPF